MTQLRENTRSAPFLIATLAGPARVGIPSEKHDRGISHPIHTPRLQSRHQAPCHSDRSGRAILCFVPRSGMRTCAVDESLLGSWVHPAVPGAMQPSACLFAGLILIR